MCGRRSQSTHSSPSYSRPYATAARWYSPPRPAREKRRACRRRWRPTARSSLLQPRRVAARASRGASPTSRAGRSAARSDGTSGSSASSSADTAPARRHRRHPDRAAPAGSAAHRLPHHRPRRVPRAQPARGPRHRARAAGMARARRSAASWSCRPRSTPPRVAAFLGRLSGRRRSRPRASARSRLPRPASRRGRRRASVAAARAGTMLCFLPGAPEIRRALPTTLVARASARASTCSRSTAGSAPTSRTPPSRRRADRRVILATNIAETTLTVPDVRVVIDTGSAQGRAIRRRPRDRQPRDRAHHAGLRRSARGTRRPAGAGRALRLWDARDRLAPRREPEIARVDLASACSTSSRGAAIRARLDWFEAPSEDAPGSMRSSCCAALGAVAGRPAHGDRPRHAAPPAASHGLPDS